MDSRDYLKLDIADKLKYKSREVAKLKNRVQRYKNRLLKEAFTRANNEDIKILVYDVVDLDDVDDSTILAYKSHGDNINIDSIIKLAKDNLPSLHRRYYESLNRFNEEYDRLEEMVEQAA